DDLGRTHRRQMDRRQLHLGGRGFARSTKDALTSPGAVASLEGPAREGRTEGPALSRISKVSAPSGSGTRTVVVVVIPLRSRSAALRKSGVVSSVSAAASSGKSNCSSHKGSLP